MVKKVPGKVLWIDMEMSGLSATDDLILEVAAIVTDWQFNEIATYHGIVKNNKTKLTERFALSSAFWDANQTARDALLKQNADGRSLSKIEDDLLAFVSDHFKIDVPVLLAGNSIHVDRRFIMAQLPRFDAKLHYRMLDVSAWKVVFAGRYRKKFVKPSSHRALDDIRGSIAELQYYLTKLK